MRSQSRDRNAQISTVETRAPPHHRETARSRPARPYLPSHRPGLSLFDDAAESVYEHYNEEVRKHIAAGQLLAEQEKELAELKARLRNRSAGSGWWSRWFGKP